jgi:SAM-dependent methyltransferase
MKLERIVTTPLDESRTEDLGGIGGEKPEVDAYGHWKNWRAEDFGIFEDAQSHYFQWHVDRATGLTGRRLRVLELGYGNGAFMGWARANGHDIVGVELNPHLIVGARAAGYSAVPTVSELPTGQEFDLVVGFDVLEHIGPDELPRTLLSLRDRLAEDGRMMFRFPNAESPLGCVYQNGDVTHVNALGVSKIRQLSASLDLHLLHWGEPLPWRVLPMRKRPKAWLVERWRSFLEWAIGDVLIGHPISFTANEVVVLRPSIRRSTLASTDMRASLP